LAPKALEGYACFFDLVNSKKVLYQTQWEEIKRLNGRDLPVFGERREG
jgi:hypothetical protein